MLSLTHLLRRRLLLAIPTSRPYSTLKPTPSPPRLPPEAQKEFEALQKAARDSFKTSTSPAAPAEAHVKVEDMLHPDVRCGAKPEFEGDVNPKTGERGGPKNDPLRYGDWAFNGRVSDF
ncbi:hypothetical protein HOY82DRAFT_647505 [Tuber indicum]|nr:hypothetical protein HOY82DRAFT_647505 [Tuber indicum]